MDYTPLRRRTDGRPQDVAWNDFPDARLRTIARLRALRAALDDPEVDGAPPGRDATETFLLATWNIRELDSAKWGRRHEEAYFYLAEVIRRFDLVAVQEVRDVAALRRLARRLGPSWRFLVSDVTAGAAGNGERLAYLYDTSRVRFLDIAGELVIPPVRVKGKTVPSQQIARTPFMASFQVGWTKFTLATVHILYGEDTAEPAARVEEIRAVATLLADRVTDDEIGNMVLLGDFNIFTAGDATMKALTSAGFTIPEGIQPLPGSNLDQSKKYDQIAVCGRAQRFELTGRAGVFDVYDHIYREADLADYRSMIDAYIEAQHAAGKKTPKLATTDRAALTQFKAWRTFQASDHLPLWVELRVDFSDEYLEELAREG